MKITLKTLVVTFNDDTPDDTVDEIRQLLMNYQGKGVFIVQDGVEEQFVPDSHDKRVAQHAKKTKG